MLPRKLDITIAFKMINLMPEFSGTDKCVTAAIIEHFNYKTGQCDPSLDRLARLLGLSRRSVIRSLSRIEKTGVLRRTRHGGHLLRNSYEPVWPQFRKLEAVWRERFNDKSRRFAEPDVSPEGCPERHLSGAESVTQTPSINQSKVTSAQESEKTTSTVPESYKEQAKEDREKRVSLPNRSDFRKWSTPSTEAVRTAAERRWNADLNRLFASKPEIYAAIIGAIDFTIQNDATDVEVRMRGEGVGYILRKLDFALASSSKPRC